MDAWSGRFFSFLRYRRSKYLRSCKYSYQNWRKCSALLSFKDSYERGEKTQLTSESSIDKKISTNDFAQWPYLFSLFINSSLHTSTIQPLDYSYSTAYLFLYSLFSINISNTCNAISIVFTRADYVCCSNEFEIFQNTSTLFSPNMGSIRSATRLFRH